MCPAAAADECLTENVVAELVDGRLVGAALATAEEHLARCEMCSAVVAHAAAAPGSGVDAALEDTQLSEDAATDDAQLARGHRVGRYEVIACVGAGAMGTVYAANDPSLDRKVALKLLRAQVAGPDLETRLLREAKTMARLSHPEVIAVFDAGMHGGRLFIAMEFVEGGTLREWVRAKARSWREILSVYVRAGRGLARAHAAGVVHRDFKPDNVLVGDDGRVRVTDFGLARGMRGDDRIAAGESESESEGETESASKSEDDGPVLDASLTRTGALIGTPVYMAPEQLAGGRADARSDVYSFCVALYEALYGERPFRGETLKQLASSKSANDVRPPSANAKIPPRLRRVLLVGLRAQSKDRYESMEALLEALDRATKIPRIAIAGGVSIALAATLALVAYRPWARTHVDTGARSIRASASSSAPLTGTEGGACTSHRECVESHGGAPWLCRQSDRTCTPIASEDCTPMFEPNDLATEDTVWLGAMFPTKGPAAAAYGTMNMMGTDFARAELAQATRALDGTNASLHVRRIALVGCDDGADPMRAARHLVDDVGVPAIMGFGSGQKLTDVAGSLLIRRGVVAIASLSSSPLLTRLPQPTALPRMVWRTTFSLEGVASAIARVLHDVLEPRRGLRTGPTRVVLVREEAAAVLEFAEALYKELVFNGKSALANGDDYRELTFASGASPDLASVIDHIVDAAPSFVVSLGTASAVRPLFEAVEARWKPGVPRPTYVVASDSLENFATYIGKNADRRRRLFAIESTSTSTANARFVMRYNGAHESHVTRVFNPGSSYDAFYLAAYATYATGREPVTGVALARAFERLSPPGSAIEVGPTRVFDALGVLTSGGRIDLQGTQSALDFDPATGEAPCDFALLCAGVAADDGGAFEDVESGIVVRAGARRAEGTLRCP